VTEVSAGLGTGRASVGAVLDFAWAAGEFTATDVMASTSLTRSTAIDAIDTLVSAAVLHELPNARAAGSYRAGRPARRFVLASDLGMVIGVDAGDNHVAVTVADPLDPRRPDEHGTHRLAAHPSDVEVGLEGVDLTTEGVAPHRDVEAVEMHGIRGGVQDVGGQQDHAGAGPVGGHTGGEALAERIEEIEDPQQLPHRGRLAAGQHQTVDGVEFLGTAHRHRARTGGSERLEMLSHVTLQREHSDGRSCHRDVSRPGVCCAERS